MFGASLPVKFWTYACTYDICIQNTLPHRDQDIFPFFMVKNKKENFKNLCTFGCQIHVRPSGIGQKRFKEDASQGNFLGYVPHMDKSFTWYDEGTHKVKVTTHARFDRGKNDLLVNNLPLNCQHLLQLNGTLVLLDKIELSSSDIDFLCDLICS